MKKRIIFLTAIFSMLNTYAQEECVEFEKAWLTSSGKSFFYTELSIVDDECFFNRTI